jgi:hypothetical protein
MGADKNSSPKRELGLCPKFTTKDSHTSLPRSSSQNGPTDPWNKPKTIPKRKRNQRRKGHRNFARTQADGPRAPGGLSVTLEQTVRKLQQNLQKCTSNNGLSVLGTRTVCEQLVLCGRSAMPRRTVCQTPPCQKQLAKRIKTKALKNTRRTQRTPGQLAPRRLFAPTRRTVCQVRTDAGTAGR